MNNVLNQDHLRELVLLGTEALRLRDPSIIEKDYYVTHLILTVGDLQNENFRLVFCGGTCLAKAHKIVKRMSEDIDFKIVIKEPAKSFSKSRLNKELKEFRILLMQRIEQSGLKIEYTSVRNEGKYSRVELSYPLLFPSSATLRPHILLEFTLSEIRLPTSPKNIKTLIEDVLIVPPLFNSSTTDCICIEETAAEKWVGLTRRVIAIQRNYHPDDKTLVRHVYDLTSITSAKLIQNDFYKLAHSVVENDAAQFRNQHPEYAENPAAEIQASLNLMKQSPEWKQRYDEFIYTMVYDDHTLPDYDSAMNVIMQLSSPTIQNLTQAVTQ